MTYLTMLPTWRRGGRGRSRLHAVEATTADGVCGILTRPTWDPPPWDPTNPRACTRCKAILNRAHQQEPTP